MKSGTEIGLRSTRNEMLANSNFVEWNIRPVQKGTVNQTIRISRFVAYSKVIFQVSIPPIVLQDSK